MLIERIRDKVAEVQMKTMPVRFRFSLPLEIVPCQFGNDANMIGAYITYATVDGEKSAEKTER